MFYRENFSSVSRIRQVKITGILACENRISVDLPGLYLENIWQEIYFFCYSTSEWEKYEDLSEVKILVFI